MIVSGMVLAFWQYVSRWPLCRKFTALPGRALLRLARQ
jgi:hypothetical protein